MSRPENATPHPNGSMGFQDNRASFWRRNRWLLWGTGSLFGCLAVLGIVVSIMAHRAEPFVRERVVQELSARFHARVELDTLHLTLGNSLHGEWGVWAEGLGLRIWPPAQVEGVDTSIVEKFFRALPY